MPSSRESSQSRDWAQVSCIAGGFFSVWATKEAQEYWSGLPCPPVGNLPNPGLKPRSLTLQSNSLPAEPPGKSKNTGVGSLSLLQGSFLIQELNQGLMHCRRILYQLSYLGSPPFDYFYPVSLPTFWLPLSNFSTLYTLPVVITNLVSFSVKSPLLLSTYMWDQTVFAFLDLFHLRWPLRAIFSCVCVCVCVCVREREMPEFPLFFLLNNIPWNTFGKLSSGHRSGKGLLSFQSQRKAMPKNAQTTTQL